MNNFLAAARNYIDTWRINKNTIANAMKMKPSTFRLKYSDNQHAYKFTDEELHKLSLVLYEMQKDLEKTLRVYKQPNK